MTDRTPARCLSFLGTLLALVLLSGCAAYQWGSSAPLPYQRIYVEPVTNDSYAPQAQSILSAKIRDVLIRDGRIQLVGSPDAADAILSVNLTEYRRTGVTRDLNDTARAQDFGVTLAAEVSLYDSTNGSFYLKDRRISETTYAYRGDPYAEVTANTTGAQELAAQSYFAAEYQATPLLARGLARQVADTILSNW